VTIQQAFQIALQHHQSGRLAEAEAIYRQILAAEPRHADVLHLLGAVAHQTGRNDVAVELIRQAIVLKPNYPEAYSNLGIALKDRGQLDEAIAAHRQAIALQPNLPEAHTNLGVALHQQGQLDEAIAAYHQAIALKPNYPEAYYNLGVALKDRGQLDEAIAAWRQAIALNPNYAEAHYNLGNALKDQGHPDEAIAAYRQALALKPNFPEAHDNLGNAQKDKGQVDEAIAAWRQALALKPNFPEAHSNLVLTLHYHPGYDAKAIAGEHERWNRQHAEPLGQFLQPHHNDPSPERRLRIGYVSPDFREHPVGRFLLPLLARHGHQSFEIFCYTQVLARDELTGQLSAHADHWRSLVGLSDQQAAELIRRDRIDILVDLAGHTANNRLLIFAHKPAPVQVTWLGYPDTTGLKTMDYRLTDAFADPPGATDHLHSEKLIRLPDCAWCFRPSDQVPPVSARPALAPGCITFGCCNTLAKITAPLLTLWSDILRALPGSRLALKNMGMRTSSTQEWIRHRFEEAGIAKERIELAADVPKFDDHLAFYDRVDIALDTFPYHGTATTCEALWMGVPVVTLAGKTHVSRVGVSILSNIGLGELVANSEGEYVRMAAELARNLPRLSGQRVSLRQRMRASPLMDAARFTGNMEAAYRTMWQRWCMEKNPSLR